MEMIPFLGNRDLKLATGRMHVTLCTTVLACQNGEPLQCYPQGWLELVIPAPRSAVAKGHRSLKGFYQSP